MQAIWPPTPQEYTVNASIWLPTPQEYMGLRLNPLESLYRQKRPVCAGGMRFAPANKKNAVFLGMRWGMRSAQAHGL